MITSLLIGEKLYVSAVGAKILEGIFGLLRGSVPGWGVGFGRTKMIEIKWCHHGGNPISNTECHQLN